jgi:Rps23 Pro-64 3,4-dihydroxylase Tpa1-like proline 4-hydroxylase
VIEFFSTPVPHIVVNNWFTDDELNLIWQEIDFLTRENILLNPTQTGSAQNTQGQLIKNNHGLFLDNLYSNRQISNILSCTRKLWRRDFVEQASKYNFVFDYLRTSNFDTCLLSYYEEGDHYLEHFDISALTALIHLYKDPLQFMGGELIIKNKIFPKENNRLILFPSCALHSVTPLKLNPNLKKFSGFGRYTISQFISHQQGLPNVEN